VASKSARAVIRKHGKFWSAYPTKEDAVLKRNEIAAASTKEKLQKLLKKILTVTAAEYPEFEAASTPG